MKKKKRNFFKQNIIGFIIGGIIFGSLGVYAAITFPSDEVSFDPSNSTLMSTNVQDAIDELYNKCNGEPTTADQILARENIVTSGSGLYEDEYEKGRYIFKGANPTNYVDFKNNITGGGVQLWRIISLEKDGTIKMMRAGGEINRIFNINSSNSWPDSSLYNEYYNSDYFPNLKQKDKVVNGVFNIGPAKWDNNDLEEEMESEKSKTWTGNIGLITISEYLRANSDKENCSTIYLNNNNIQTCRQTNWMSKLTEYQDLHLTITPMEDKPEFIFNISFRDGLIGGASIGYSDYASAPVVYISAHDVTLSGYGSEENPYIIN